MPLYLPQQTLSTLGAQASDADLDAIAALTTTGLIDRTGSGTATTRATGTTGLNVLAAANAAAARTEISAQEIFTFATWTPAYILTTSGSVTTNIAEGSYLLMPPDFVVIQIVLRSASVTEAVGNVQLTLPFTATSRVYSLSVGSVSAWGASLTTFIRAETAANSAAINLLKNIPSAAGQFVVGSDLNTAVNGNLIRVSGIYRRAI